MSWFVDLPGLLGGGTVGGWTVPLTGSRGPSSIGGGVFALEGGLPTKDVESLILKEKSAIENHLETDKTYLEIFILWKIA